MEAVEINSLATPDLSSPALIEGLPGSGLVGMFAAEHLVEELKGRPVRQVYSKYFPPVVPVDNEATANLAHLTVYAVEEEKRDLLVLTGRLQAEDSIGQYELTDAVLDIAADFNVSDVYTLGGAVMGEPVEDHDVVGAVADGSDHLKEQLKAADVSFQHEGTPTTIGGVSGLLLGVGAYRKFSAGCILGTTSGFHADPKAARIVLETLQELFDFSIDLESFDNKTEEKKESVNKLLEMLPDMSPQEQQSDEGLRYFG